MVHVWGLSLLTVHTRQVVRHWVVESPVGDCLKLGHWGLLKDDIFTGHFVLTQSPKFSTCRTGLHGIHPVLQESQQLGCSKVLSAHDHTPVGDLIWCIPTLEDSRSNECQWKFTVAAIRNGFGNPTTDV